tara:strand:+ start:308 stop:2104 length:1797 start_codon:yes stop_codon:yes gene_type:complete
MSTASQYDTRQSVIQQKPQYIEDIDQALLGKYFGEPLKEGDEYTDPQTGETRVLEAGDPVVGQLMGGTMDDPSIFNIPDYVQAGEQRLDAEGNVIEASRTPGAADLQNTVAATFGTEKGRDDFMGRYDPYFLDETDTPKYLPEAATALGAGKTSIEKGLADYFPDAKTYLDAGRGTTGAKGIYDTALSGVRDDIGKGTDTFDAKTRSDSLLGDAQSTVKGGLGQFTPESIDSGGKFGAETAFDRRTGRAFELAEQGLGKFDPTSAQEFMDPYKEQVIDAAMKRIDREGSKMRQAGAAQAISAGAFGGSRSGVQAAETERAISEQKQNTIAGLLSQGYDKSMANAMATDEAGRKRALQASGVTGQLGATGANLESSAFSDAARRGLAAATTEGQMGQKAYEDAMKRQLGAGQELGRLGTTQLGAESKAFESGEDRMLKAADMYRSMGLSSAEAQVRAAEDVKKRDLEAGRLTGGLGQSYGQMGGMQADIGRAYGQLAGGAADIGRVYAGMQPADMGFMYEMGGKQRAYAQQLEDMGRKNVLNQTQQALAPYSYGQTFLTGSPSASMYGEFTNTPQTTPDPFMQGVGMYTNMQGINQLTG